MQEPVATSMCLCKYQLKVKACVCPFLFSPPPNNNSDFNIYTHTCTQWLPPAWTFQWIYLIYRWLLASYFSGWLLFYAIVSGEGGKFLIYLSNWGYLFWVSYLLSAAISVTLSFIRAWACSNVVYFPRRRYSVVLEESKAHSACCSCRRSADNTNCCHKLTWFLFLIGAESAVLICILFWTTLYNTEDATGAISLHLHLINGIVAVIDLWVSGVPVYLLHFLYIQLFGSVYIGFTGIYYAFNGTNLANETAIYPVLDYGSNPGLAAGLAVGMVVAGTVVIHLLFLLQYLCRRWLTTRLLFKYKRRYRLSFSSSIAVRVGSRQNSVTPPPSSTSSSSSACTDTTPILAHSKQRSAHSSHESFF